MALYGEINVDIDALKRWAKNISIDELLLGEEFVYDILSIQAKAAFTFIERLSSESDWRDVQRLISRHLSCKLFCGQDYSLHFANYYERFVVPSNLKTYKKIIRGFDYVDYGEIRIFNEDKLIASIGQISDLLWSSYYEYFINVEDYGEIEVPFHNQNTDRYLSIQLYDVENLELDEINRMINEILLRVSMEHDLDFELANLDMAYKLGGENNTYEMDFDSCVFEYVPSLYMNNALHTNDVRMAYLSFYHVLEYFFVRVQNYQFLDEFNRLSFNPINHRELKKILHRYSKSLNERESLKLVLKRTIDVEELILWINSDVERIKKYCESDIYSLDLDKPNEKILASLTERIYSYRCSIAHAKGDIDEALSIPLINDKNIEKELELMKFISYEVLKVCSEQEH